MWFDIKYTPADDAGNTTTIMRDDNESAAREQFTSRYPQKEIVSIASIHVD
jgi:hypothetical protein